MNHKWKVIGAVAVAASLVAAPFVGATAASADEPLVGVVGSLQPWSSETNDPSYWENKYKNVKADCYSHGSSGGNAHGAVTDDGKTVTLNQFDQSWPGDHWALLVVKGGSVSNNVIENPQAGVAYASPLNDGGKQSNVSHWIVCKGTTPEQPKYAIPVQPTAEAGIETCVNYESVDANGTITLHPFENGYWAEGSGTLTDVAPGEYMFTAVANPGYTIQGEDQFFVTVPASVDVECELPEKPDPKVEYGQWGNWVVDCETETAERVRWVYTFEPIWNAETKEWEYATEAVVTSETETREATAEECPIPEKPADKVVVGEWSKPQITCENKPLDEVTITREVTTTPYVWDAESRSWVEGESVVTTEEATYVVTSEDIKALECPVTPTPTATPTTPAKAAVTPPTKGGLAVTGGDVNPLLPLGAIVASALGGLLVTLGVIRRRRSA